MTKKKKKMFLTVDHIFYLCCKQLQTKKLLWLAFTRLLPPAFAFGAAVERSKYYPKVQGFESQLALGECGVEKSRICYSEREKDIGIKILYKI